MPCPPPANHGQTLITVDQFLGTRSKWISYWEPAKTPPTRRRGRCPREFRRDAAALVIDQERTIADVARELGIVEQTLGNWVRQERIDRGKREGTTTELREENAQLRREIKRLTMERDLLKNATAFWVKESDR